MIRVKRFSLLLGLITLYQLLLGLPAFALTNQLKGHPSPYLALHANDPVAWQEWNKEAVELARRENKLLYVSIGYFSCHWCHVMQRESYQNAEIAQFLNKHFIPVKVDRELEAALDARMIEFIESTRGMGGWPLNVFITPQGHPLYAVLYLPSKEFLSVLQQLQKMWTKDRASLERLAQSAAVTPSGPGRPLIDVRQAQGYAERIVADTLALADFIQGGFGEQSKFPSVPQLAFLLTRQARYPDPRLKEFLLLTLDQMARNGLQDHLGGGFFRYTVDPAWKTPHFEKMLYGNALLAHLYLRAGRQFARKDYEAVAERTLNFMAQELRDPTTGAFIASLSAVDDKNVEGGYYLWHRDQLATLLTSEERNVFKLAWGMIDAAPFENGYLPIRGMPSEDIARMLKLDRRQVEKLLERAADKLIRARQKRRLPRDIKLLAGWNGLALMAYAEAARLTGNEYYRWQANGVRDYLAKVLWDGQALRRAVNNGRPVGAVTLEDYAYVARGFLEWARLTGKEEDYALAMKVVTAAWKRFYGPSGWRLAESSLIQAEEGQDIVADGPMPSPSGMLAEVSLHLAERYGDRALREQVLSALNSGHAVLKKNPFWYATHVGAMLAAPDTPQPVRRNKDAKNRQD